MEVVPEIRSPHPDNIDLDVIEKLDEMDLEERAECTAQFYNELLDEEDWLCPVDCEQDSQKDVKHSTNHRTTRKKKVKPRSKLYGFFNKKKRSPLYHTKTLPQSSSQTQLQDTDSSQRKASKNRSEKPSKNVPRKGKMMNKRQPTIQYTTDAAFLAKIVERKKQDATSNVHAETQVHATNSQRKVSENRRVILEKSTKKNSPKGQDMMNKRRPSFSEEEEGTPFPTKIVERTMHGETGNVRKQQTTKKKYSKFKLRRMNLRH